MWKLSNIIIKIMKNHLSLQSVLKRFLLSKKLLKFNFVKNLHLKLICFYI